MNIQQIILNKNIYFICNDNGNIILKCDQDYYYYNYSLFNNNQCEYYYLDDTNTYLIDYETGQIFLKGSRIVELENDNKLKLDYENKQIIVFKDQTILC